MILESITHDDHDGRQQTWIAVGRAAERLPAWERTCKVTHSINGAF